MSDRMRSTDDERLVPTDLGDGTVPDADIATDEVGARTDADEADILEQSEAAVSDDLLEDEEATEGLDDEPDV